MSEKIRRSNKAILEELQKLYPDTFPQDNLRVLKVGIYHDILKDEPAPI
jgi:hypothetical protein